MSGWLVISPPVESVSHYCCDHRNIWKYNYRENQYYFTAGHSFCCIKGLVGVELLSWIDIISVLLLEYSMLRIGGQVPNNIFSSKQREISNQYWFEERLTLMRGWMTPKWDVWLWRTGARQPPGVTQTWGLQCHFSHRPDQSSQSTSESDRFISLTKDKSL